MNLVIRSALYGCIALIFLTPLSVLSQDSDTKNDTSGVTFDSWFNGDREQRIALVPNEIGLLLAPGVDGASASVPIPAGTAVIEASSRVLRLEITDETPVTDFFSDSTSQSLANVGRFAAVYSNTGKGGEGTFMMSGEILLHPADQASDVEVDGVARSLGSNFLRLAGDRTARIYSCDPGPNCLQVANSLYESGSVEFAYPNWFIQTEKHLVINDPLYVHQWHLENTGQSGGIAGEDVKAQGAWDQGVSGNGITIAIIDDSMETTHEDLIANTGGNSPLAPHIDLLDGDSNPNPASSSDRHGTSVSGIAAASGQNNTGVTGAAYDASLNGIRLIGGTITFDQVAQALTHNINHPVQPNDIYNNSWGFVTNGGLLSIPIVESAFEFGTTNGRSGDGVVYVFSAGNSGASSDNTNYTSLTASRYTISVGASHDDGVQSSYSEPGANLLINAPSNEFMSAGTITTDVTGTGGYNSPPPTGNNNYTSTFGGTSSSAPLVSGVIALVLEANPNLTWRDVQRLIAYTADKNDPSEPDWVVNGDGRDVNHLYGFGRIDADAAVSAATGWQNLGPELVDVEEVTPNLAIPAGGGEVSVTINVQTPINDTETVLITVDSDHSFWGDLDVKLISPAGTESRLTELHTAAGAGLSGGYTFSSVRHFGEDPNGVWELVFEDNVILDTGSVDYLKLEIFGTQTVVGAECNGLAVTVNMNDGDLPTSNSDVILGTPGADLIDAGSGNDTICADGGDDEIFGGGGVDWIDGGPGRDLIFGEAGDDTIFGAGQADEIDGGGGDDLIYGGNGNDVLAGRIGEDRIFGEDGVDSISGGPQADYIDAGPGATVGTESFVSGGSGADTIHGGPDADDLRGGGGSDLIYGKGGRDVITGSTGQDEIHGGPGADDIRGQESPDMIFGDGGNDVITGGAGDDVLDGGAGASDSCSGQSGTSDSAVNCETVTSVP